VAAVTQISMFDVHGLAVETSSSATVGPGTAVCVDAGGRRITAALPSDASFDLRGFVDLELRIAFVVALRMRGLMHLHAAAAVAPDLRALLISGSGGTGKSTLLTALVTAGWAYLGDDAVFLAPDGGLRAFPRPFHLSLEAARAISVPVEGRVRRGTGKLDVDPQVAFPGLLCWRCPPPAAILLPRIEARSTTEVESVARPEALAVLLATSAFAASAVPGAAQQRERLARLVDGAQVYRIRLGRDLLEDARATACRIAAAL
jgi:hypothetical protein